MFDEFTHRPTHTVEPRTGEEHQWYILARAYPNATLVLLLLESRTDTVVGI